MMKTLRILCCMLLLLIPQTAFAENLLVKVGPTIQVGQKATLSFSGEATLFEGGRPLVTEAASSWKIVADGGRVRVLTNSGVYESEPGNFSLTSSAGMTYQKRTYPETLRFVVNQDGLCVINDVDLETYLRGVLPKEMSPSFPLESLMAQAVASRGFALANKKKFVKKGYQLDDTTSSQVYHGMKVWDARTDRAISETKGLIPIYQGRVADTIFHATSGGHTESSAAVWGGESVPYMRGVEDPHSTNTTAATWNLEKSADEAKKILEGSYPALGEIKAVRIAERLDGRRVKKLELIGTKSSTRISGDKFRNLFGATKMKSTWFAFGQGAAQEVTSQKSVLTKSGRRPVKNEEKVLTAKGVTTKSFGSSLGNSEVYRFDGPLVVKGKGYGHGVGMSQYGAVEMAKQGKTFQEILSFYYPGISVERGN